MVVEITNFVHVIGIAFQRKLQNGESNALLTFSEIWRICEAARLPRATGPTVWSNDPRKGFARRIFEAIENLEADGYAWRLYGGPPEKRVMLHIGLTAAGRTWLRGVIFAHQDRAPEPSENQIILN